MCLCHAATHSSCQHGLPVSWLSSCAGICCSVWSTSGESAHARRRCTWAALDVPSSSEVSPSTVMGWERMSVVGPVVGTASELLWGAGPSLYSESDCWGQGRSGEAGRSGGEVALLGLSVWGAGSLFRRSDLGAGEGGAGSAGPLTDWLCSGEGVFLGVSAPEAELRLLVPEARLRGGLPAVEACGNAWSPVWLMALASPASRD